MIVDMEATPCHISSLLICQAVAQGGQVKLRVQVLDDGAGRPTIVGMEAAQLSFDSISIVTSGAKLSWLYNAVVALAKTPIQAAITREVAAQVSFLIASST